jgi:hypothetical protein
MFSELDIRCLLGHVPDYRDPNDLVIIEKRLRNFVYDASYVCENFTHDENRSSKENEYRQAVSRIWLYSTRNLQADEI